MVTGRDDPEYWKSYIENLIDLIDELEATLNGKHPDGVSDKEATLNFLKHRKYYRDEAELALKKTRDQNGE